MAGYDIIGDIHGCAAELTALLGQLGYRPDRDGVHQHPERTAVFVGDLIDRGPGQLEVLRTVKAMVDAGAAKITMGNHEFNAITYAMNHPETGEPLRPNNDKNTRQHQAFLDQLTPDQQAYYRQWFTTLPLWLDLGEIRVVHACWHEPSMRAVEKATNRSGRLTTLEHYVAASTKGDELYEAVETLLKGPEISLVDHGADPYWDKDHHRREQARIRWWDGDATTLRELAETRGALTEDGRPYPPPPAVPIDPDEGRTYLYTDEVPLFYGHYWRSWEPAHTEDWTRYTACVDFSAVKSGRLVAYRFNGEPTILRDNYVPHTRDVVAPTPSA
jgi:hypothetical protein